MQKSQIVWIALLVLAMIIAKVYPSSWQAYRRGKQSLTQNNLPEAIANFERSIHFYGPFNPWVKSSIQELWHIGETAEQSGNRTLALDAYRSLRSSLYAVRSTYTPFKEWIPRCDERISTLVAADPEYQARHPTLSQEALKERVAETLTRNPAPSVGWSIIVEIGFLSWVGGTIGFILRVLGDKKEFPTRQAIFWAGIVVVGYALWVLGLIKA